MTMRIHQAMTLIALPVLLASTAAPAVAQSGYQDTATLDAAVAGFTGRPIGAEGGARMAVDHRLRLATCGTLVMAWHGDAHDSVVVSCPNPAWRIFVPVVMPVAPPPAAPQAAAAPVEKPEPVIKRGDPVTIEVNASGFSVSRDGIAMNDAIAGGRLLVTVDGSRKPVQAVALENGRATLPGWSQ